MRRIRTIMLASLLGVGLVPALAGAETKAKPAPAKKEPAKLAAKKPAKPRKPVSAEHKKALAERLYGGFKLGMTKDEVIAVFSKQLDERYDEKIKDTSDISAQDRLRADKRKEVTRLQQSYISFETAKASSWDVSIVEDEFAHNTGEAMLERWENQGGENQRRFFFFYDGKLWKMFIQLDVSTLPADQKNFATFQKNLEGKYGPGDVEDGRISWHTDEFDARAVDKLKTYDALALVIEDPKVRTQVLATRETKAAPKHQTSSVIKAMVDPDHTDHPDVKANNDAVNDVIRAQGGTPKK